MYIYIYIYGTLLKLTFLVDSSHGWVKKGIPSTQAYFKKFWQSFQEWYYLYIYIYKTRLQTLVL